MSISPCQDRVLVKVVKQDNKTKSGIYLPESATNNDSYHIGEIINVGPGKKNTAGEFLPMSNFNTGDKVIFGQYAGTKIKLEGDEHIILKEEDILATVA